MPAMKKNKSLNLRISADDMELLTRAAKICGKSLSAFVTESSRYSAQEELLKQRFIGVNAEVFDWLETEFNRQGKARDTLVKLFQAGDKADWID